MVKYNVFERKTDLTSVQIINGNILGPIYAYTTGSVHDIEYSSSYTSESISSVTHWYKKGKNYFDYMASRDQIKYILQDNSYETLAPEEQKITCRLFVVPAESRSLYYNAEEQRKNWDIFAKQMINCRYDRWERGRSYASFALGVNASTQMGIETNDIAKEWKDYNTNKLFEWFEGTGSYSGSGYPATNYYTASIGNNILEILRDGIKH